MALRHGKGGEMRGIFAVGFRRNQSRRNTHPESVGTNRGNKELRERDYNRMLWSDGW